MEFRGDPHSSSDHYYYRYCFTSTEAMRLIRDGRTPLTSSDTQSRELSGSDHIQILLYVHRNHEAY